MIVMIRVPLFIPRFTTDYYTNYMYLLKKKNYLALLVDITFFLIITIPIFYLVKINQKKLKEEDKI